MHIHVYECILTEIAVLNSAQSKYVLWLLKHIYMYPMRLLTICKWWWQTVYLFSWGRV